MKLTDSIKFSGELTIKVRDAATKKVLRTIETPNVICIGMLEALQRLMTFYPETDWEADCESELYGIVPKQERIWAMRAGDDNTTPTYSDTDLGNKIFWKRCDGINSKTGMSINVGGVTGLLECQMTMESGEGNDTPNPVYKEVGLFTRGTDNDPDPSVTTGARLMAHQIHAAVEKDSSISIEYTWRIRITAS